MKKLSINNTKPIQEDFWGNGAIYHGYAGMPDTDGRVYTEEQCELEAERAGNMRLKIARTMYKWYAWDDEKQEWNWQNERMQALYRWLQRMKDRNIIVALNTGWCSPGDVCSASWNGKSPFKVEGDWQKSCENFGNWVSETCHQLIELRGFDNVKILTMFTEPQNLAGKPTIEGMNAYECWRDAVKAAHDALVRDGRRHLVKIMGPNEASTVSYDMVKWVVENCSDFVDIFSGHTYQGKKSLKNDDKILTGETSMYTDRCGGRLVRDITLKPFTEYTGKVTYCYDGITEDTTGNFIYGVFVKHSAKDSYTPDGKPVDSLCKDSVTYVDSTNISDKYQTVTFKFKTEEETEGTVGFLNDILNAGNVYVDSMELFEKDSTENIIENGHFEDYYFGWNNYIVYALSNDSYDDWCHWAEGAIRHLPKDAAFCFDEYNAIYDRDYSRINHGCEICDIAIALMNKGVQSSLMWTIFDQQWPNSHSTSSDSFYDGDHRHGVMPTLFRSLVPHKSYYAFTMLSRYVSGIGGTKVYKGVGEEGVHTTMSVSPEGHVTVVVTNIFAEPFKFKIDFAKPLNVNLNRHYFDPKTCVPDEKAEIIGTDIVLENVKDSIEDTISGYGVIVYTTTDD